MYMCSCIYASSLVVIPVTPHKAVKGIGIRAVLEHEQKNALVINMFTIFRENIVYQITKKRDWWFVFF